MKFIYTDCLDYIDPEYDFINDEYSVGRQPYWDDLYPHEYMDTPPYDGLMVSRAIVGDHVFSGKYTQSQAMRFRREGARNFLRYHEKDFPGSIMFGDCGAFQYVKYEVPPYTPEEILDFYDDGGFSHGCSPDHIIFEFDPTPDRKSSSTFIKETVKKRYDITLALAEQFYKLSGPMKKKFTPVGVIQGWSPQSMAKAAESLAGMGYDYLAVGGLVPLKTDLIHLAISAIKERISEKIKLHLLGFAKADQLAEFLPYKIHSFDTSSPLIKAFKDGRRNYYLPAENSKIDYYMAIRIPQVEQNNTLKKKIKTGLYRQEDLKCLESKALDAIRKYSKKLRSLEETIAAIMDYSRILFLKEKHSDVKNEKFLLNIKKEYEKTLTARPWEKCSCKICRKIGAEVVIFRGSNRNKRRGIHNLYVFHRFLKSLTSGE